MSKPDDIPQDVWGAAEAVGEALYGRHSRGWVMWPFMSESGLKPQIIVARAIFAEREACAALVDAGFEREVGEAWLASRSSKNDKCVHDRFMYEDCERCAAIAIRKRGEAKP